MEAMQTPATAQMPHAKLVERLFNLAAMHNVRFDGAVWLSKQDLPAELKERVKGSFCSVRLDRAGTMTVHTWEESYHNGDPYNEESFETEAPESMLNAAIERHTERVLNAMEEEDLMLQKMQRRMRLRLTLEAKLTTPAS